MYKTPEYRLNLSRAITYCDTSGTICLTIKSHTEVDRMLKQGNWRKPWISSIGNYFILLMRARLTSVMLETFYFAVILSSVFFYVDKFAFGFCSWSTQVIVWNVLESPSCSRIPGYDVIMELASWQTPNTPPRQTPGTDATS